MKNNSQTDVKRQIIAIFACFIYFVVAAQTIQKGVVQEYNEKSKKTVLPGVELKVYPAQSTVSEKDGTFQLEFLTLKPGERINVRRIEKAGYEIFNKEALEQWNLSPTMPFFIVMCRSDKFKKLKDLYFRNSEEQYNKQYRSAQEELKKLKEQNAIQQEEYYERLRQIETEYAKQLENLDNYVDRFARIDLSELSNTEQEIIDLVQLGRIDEAIAKYENLNASEKLLNNIAKRKKIQSAIAQLSETNNTLSDAGDTLYAVVERQIQTLQLAGGKENNKKIRQLYCEIADADTTNINWLLKSGGYLFVYLADYPLALRYFTNALHSALGKNEGSNPDVAKAYNNIGCVYYAQGNMQKALECHEKALKIREQIYGTAHEDIGMTYYNIGNIYKDQGNYTTALDFYLNALKIQGNLSCNRTSNTATIYSGLGNVYNLQGEYTKALDCHMKSLEIREAVLCENHPDIASAYNNIANVYNSMGENKKALEFYLKSLAIEELVLGLDHPNVADSYNNIGTSYYSQRKYAEALDYLKKALALRKRFFTQNHPDIAMSYNNLGAVYYSMGEKMKALEYYSKSLNIREQIFGLNHPDVALSYNNIGNVYMSEKEYDKAADVYFKALNIQKQLLGADHPDVATLYNNIGCMYEKQSDYVRALEYHQKALEIRENNFGINNHDVASSYDNMGDAYWSGKQYSKALACHEKALDINRQISYDDNSIATLCMKIGAEYGSQRDYISSSKFIGEGINIYEGLLEADNPIIQKYYMIYFMTMLHCIETDSKYVDKITDFMSDKLWVGVVGHNMPTKVKGLTGEYYILEYEKWTYDTNYNLETLPSFMDKPKTLVIFKGNEVSKHDSEEKIGMNFSIKKVTLAEKEEIARIYRQWKDDGEK